MELNWYVLTYAIHTPTNAVFINLIKSFKFTLKYTIISPLHVSVFNDLHQELYLYLTKVIFMLKHSVKLRRYINQVMWQRVVGRHAALRHAATSTECSQIHIAEGPVCPVCEHGHVPWDTITVSSGRCPLASERRHCCRELFP